MLISKFIQVLFLTSFACSPARSDECGEGFCPTKDVRLNVDHKDRLHPLVRLMNEHTSATSAKFRTLSGRDIDIYYDNGKGGTEQARLTPGTESTTNTYVGHSFFATPSGEKSNVITRFTIAEGKVLYLIEDPEYPADEDVLIQSRNEEQFIKEYYERTGIIWRHYYGPDGPRPPPILYMWPAERVGDVHAVVSHEGYWNCDQDKATCQSSQPIDFTLEVASLAPRVFMIDNFLNTFEADHIINVSKAKVHRSTVGSRDGGGTRSSSTRTSSNTWIKRESSEFFDSLYRRAADVLRLDEAILFSNRNAEDIQVVHYINGQKYDAHHDWGVSGYPESRYLTLLLYLTDMPHEDAGGETSFPKGNNGKGLKVQPKKGNAVLFYDLLPDGNGDDLSLHAALPAVDGEKWLANFWVWDPKRK